MSTSQPSPTPQAPPIYGLVAEFASPAALVAAAKLVQEAGYRRFDAHSPFPVHGIDSAMGTRMSKLPYVVLLGGLAGLACGLLLQWWTNTIDYPFNISGKPLFSLPANIPIVFELTILGAGLTAFFGMLAQNGLPRLHHPLLTNERFRRVTSDGFFLSIEACDSHFDAVQTAALLKTANAVTVETVVAASAAHYQIPRALTYAAVIAVLLSLVPLMLFWRSRYETTTLPPIDLIDDMDNQPKYRAQAASTFFADGRAYREPVAGTVAQEDSSSDTVLWQGKNGDAFATALPPSIHADAAFMRRGQERFAIYCAPCHGLAGGGDGPVARRAEELREGTWVQPTALTADHVRAQPLGQLVNTMTNGIRTMPPYGPQLAPADRWAIAIYVKALQRSSSTSIDDVPEDTRSSLK